jgi:adenylate cyclase
VKTASSTEPAPPCSSAPAGLRSDVIDGIGAWLADGARSASSSQDVLTELCERLLAAGLPLWRVAVFVQTLHPQVMARRFLWRPGEQAAVAEASFAMAADESFRSSPITHIRTTGEAIHRPLHRADCPIDFQFLLEAREEGITDYLALPLHFTNGEIHVATFTTRQPSGFTPAQMADIGAIIAPLARVAEVRALRRTAINLLDAYVGHDAGERILAGRIQRGDTETIKAAIWFSDMRGFTRLVDGLAPEAVIVRLNAFYDCLVPEIEAERGEVLKFIGDGLLAIFRMADEAETRAVCARALAAARKARARIEAVQPTDGEAPLRFGLALHVGEALYGNIGGGSRLDFTCIGPAINLAARMENTAARLGRVVIASRAFAGCLPQDFTALGAFELAGFREPQTLFGLADEPD